ncbi:hypothetical protein [Sinomonas sp.]|uniref:hypothetical protein n=1 Tax=Sinomonas sp. TaxID=1914986 RepID=UPI002FE338C6
MKTHPEEKTLRDQVRGILRETMEWPALPEEHRDRLNRLMLEHPDHPETVLVEHLHALRREDPEQELLAG